MNKKLLELLYRSFDGELSKKEHTIIMNALESSEELKKEQERIIKIRKNIAVGLNQTFQPPFADKIMRTIRSQKEPQNRQIDEFFNALVLSFRKIAVAGALGALIILTTNFISGGEISLDTALALHNLNIEDAWSLNDLISGIVK